MDINTFNRHDEVSKYQALWEGTYLACKEIPGFKVQLWAVSTFFVEVFFSVEQQEISHIEAFTHTRTLERYLNRMNLPESLV